MSKLSFLDGSAPSEPEVVQSEPVEQPEGPARGADGKFVSAAVETLEPQVEAPVPEPVQEPPAQVAAPAPTEPGHVPISALLDEREKRQTETRAREALERQLADLKAAQTPPAPVARPRPDEDPDAYAGSIDQSVQAQLFEQRREFSRRWAVKEHGEDLVKQVHEWAQTKCDEDPHFNAQLINSSDLYETAMQAWKRDQLLSKVQPDDLDGYLAWKAARDAGAQTPAPVAQAAPLLAPPPKVPTPSLATAPSAGGLTHVPSGPGRAFDAMFTK